MNRKLINIILFLLYSVLNLNAQSISFAEDTNERGYFQRPYLRYEAEPEKCETNGRFLYPTYDQRELQSEASNQSAVQLIEENSFVQWRSDQAADGLTIRFSLPDNTDGTGLQGTLALYLDEEFVQNISLNSYWAWQYILKSGSKYPDNIPDSLTKFPRMRFDEIHVKLIRKISANSIIRLVKEDNTEVPYTIDFVELEEIPKAVTFESVTNENKIAYSPEEGKLQNFISQNRGKTIFLPEGRYEVDGRIFITGDGTKLIGAGMWYTEIFFTASSDERSTYNQRGIETSNSNIVIEGLYLNTINNKRYYNNDVIYQVGKGLMGSFGSNSVIRNVWIEHFECGGWIEGANNLIVQNCRFRNNYADGMNLAHGSKNSVVEHCSFRNNGDDDMASWSRGDRLCENIVYRYNTSENNWRASGLGFFGGKQNKASNIVIIDPMEAGFRVTSDFPGMPFSNEGFTEFENISVYNGGVTAGVPGIGGDLWGNQQGALHILSSTRYDLQNIKFSNIDLYNSKNDAVFIGSTTRSIRNLIFYDIHIHKTQRYGIFFYNPKGNGSYCNIQYEDIGAASSTNFMPSSFLFTENCSTVSVPKIKEPELEVVSLEGALQIAGKESISVSVFDIWGRKHYQSSILSGQITIPNLSSGVYVLRWDDHKSMKVIVR